MVVLIGSYLLIVFVLPVAISTVIGYRGLPVGRQCAQCAGETLHLVDTRLRALSRILPIAVLQRRWCLSCGWEGTVRLPRTARPARVRLPDRTPRQAVAGTQQDHAHAAAPTQTLNVRSLDVDGTPWRVMLQCWTSTGLFYGRLVFVAPSGRLWLDAVESFSGRNEHEVLGQAQSLPEPLLTNRLRRLVR